MNALPSSFQAMMSSDWGSHTISYVFTRKEGTLMLVLVPPFLIAAGWESAGYYDYLDVYWSMAISCMRAFAVPPIWFCSGMMGELEPYSVSVAARNSSPFPYSCYGDILTVLSLASFFCLMAVYVLMCSDSIFYYFLYFYKLYINEFY